MEITNANAGTLMPYIAAQLRDCTFFALDLEFTGIDRDGPECGADSPSAVVDSLMRQPADAYPAKLEALKPYSVVQIGFSIFTREKPTTADGSLSPDADPLAPTVESLAHDLAEYVPDADAADYCVTFLKAAVKEYGSRSAPDNSQSEAAVGGWKAVAMFIAKEVAQVAQLMSSLQQGEVPAKANGQSNQEVHHATDSPAELLHRYCFLDALSRVAARRSREAEHKARAASPLPAAAKNGGSSPPPTVAAEDDLGAAKYRVQTFTAYMFPTVLDKNHNVSLNVDTVEFLVNNNIDLMRWVRDGLRFTPLPRVAAAIAQEAAAREQVTQQLVDPHHHLPHFTERFHGKLDSLLPFSPAELQLVKFVLSLFDGVPSPELARVTSSYVGALRPLIQFSRGEVAESALPESMFLRDKMYHEEMAALAALGITKANRRFARMTALGGANAGGGGGGGGSSTAAVQRSALAEHGNGTALLKTLLYATEVQQKPIVLYNGYTDLMFLLLSLYGPQHMPPSLEAFKAVVHRHFPRVYDTRILACAGPLQAYGNFTGKLSKVVEELAKVPQVASRISFEFDGLAMGGLDPSLSAAAHNAGYDAMMTGKLFAYATAGIQHAQGDYENYLNFLATYSTLLSINLTEAEDGVLQETPTPVYFLADVASLHVNSIREALRRAGLTALVMYRGNGYTIQPVGQSCSAQGFAKRAEAALTQMAGSAVTLLQIDI